jgi:hypothetical protein
LENTMTVSGATGPSQPRHNKSDNAAPQQSAEIIPHPATWRQLPTEQYLDHTVDIENVPIPLTRFRGIKMVRPNLETVCKGWAELINEVASSPAPTVARKDRVPYYIGCSLKEAEFVGETREKALERGQSTIGKQRSSPHIDMLGPALFLDHDGDVLSVEPSLRALGTAAVIYSSHSFGFPEGQSRAAVESFFC